MSKQLLIETRNFSPKPIKISEGQTGNGNMFVEGILTTVEVKNGNSRYYSRELWEREINKFNQYIVNKTSQCTGELDHPDSEIINLKNVSHAIRKIWWDGDNIMGLIEIFCDQGEKGTPSGRIWGALIKNGLVTGISSRGMGSLKQVGEIMEVAEDFSLLTFDSVSNPSNPDSWMNKTNLNESISSPINGKYNKINSIITDILCSNGNCPIL